MKILQINAVYGKGSTGRTTKELHEYLLNCGVTSYVACSDIAGLSENTYKIGNIIDRKAHAVLSRFTGKQGYFSKAATKKLIRFIDNIAPDIIHLRNLHGNYIHIPMLLKYIIDNKIATVITLHDCWFYTGKCMLYIEFNCNKWTDKCGHCPALKQGNKSYFFDCSTSMLKDKEKYLSSIDRLAVIGVSQWTTNDVKKSILKNAMIIKCIYNWIDLDQFRPRNGSEYCTKLRLEDKFIILGVASKWTKQKGIHIFWEIANMLPDDCHIVLVGGVPENIQANKKITYIGEMNDVRLLSEIYSMADVFVNPTIMETFGKTNAEALASGIPVIAYNSTAAPELIGRNGKCGFLVDNNSAKEYLKNILLVKAKGKNFFASEARRRAELLFSKEDNIKKYYEVYKMLLDG